jgi:hypothetical protein
MTMQKLKDMLGQGSVELDEAQARTIDERLKVVQEAMDVAPKTMAWKMRARVGTRVRWYEEVEEVRR